MNIPENALLFEVCFWSLFQSLFRWRVNRKNTGRSSKSVALFTQFSLAHRPWSHLCSPPVGCALYLCSCHRELAASTTSHLYFYHKFKRKSRRASLEALKSISRNIPVWRNVHHTLESLQAFSQPLFSPTYLLPSLNKDFLGPFVCPATFQTPHFLWLCDWQRYASLPLWLVLYCRITEFLLFFESKWIPPFFVFDSHYFSVYRHSSEIAWVWFHTTAIEQII